MGPSRVKWYDRQLWDAELVQNTVINSTEVSEMFLLRMQAAVEQWEKQLRKWLEHISEYSDEIAPMADALKKAAPAGFYPAELPYQLDLSSSRRSMSGYASHVPHI